MNSKQPERIPLSAAHRLSAAQAARLLGVHVMTIVRWWRVGLRGRKLRSARVGGRRWTTKKWLEEFLQEEESDGSVESRRRQEVAAANVALQERCESKGHRGERPTGQGKPSNENA